MKTVQNFVAPESVLEAIYGKTSLETGLSEKRRDEVIAAAIFTSFRNQEFGTRFQLPADFRSINHEEDAEGIDIKISDPNGRTKELQIKGIHIKRSIERRKGHLTKGVARILGRKSQRMIERDSEELAKIVKDELAKIIQDYNGIYLIIYVSADLATQTSLQAAVKRNYETISKIRAKEIWFIRNVPVRAIHGKKSSTSSHAYVLMKVMPDRQTFGYSFAF